MTQDELLNKCINDWKKQNRKYNKDWDYYIGETDAVKSYRKLQSDNYNNFIANVNFMKKFIHDEANYLLGNDISYISKTSNEKIIQAIDYNFDPWNRTHNIDLLASGLTFSKAYELVYPNKRGFKGMILDPRTCYLYENDFGETEFALRFFKKKFDRTQYVDVYYADRIYHCEYTGGKLKECKKEDYNIFGEVPISVLDVGEYRTIMSDIKKLQDSFETNLSDSINTISDFRTAYLKVIGADISDEQAKRMKTEGMINIPDGDKNKIDVDFLIKNINDTFVNNTLKLNKDLIYELSGHINLNEKLTSNTSSLTLKTKILGLMFRTKYNARVFTDCTKNRLRLLFKYLDYINVTPTGFDASDIKCVYSPSLPQDDLMMAQIFSQCQNLGIFSKETMRSQISFIENTQEEDKKCKAENETENIGSKLMDKVRNENKDKVVDDNGS